MTSGVTKKEVGSYGLYFLGQMIFYTLVSYMTTYFTDIGIAARYVAGLILVTKVWDSINDPIFGVLMDKVKFKKGKFVPWLKISLIAIPITTILIFAIPEGLPVIGKVAWAAVAYMLWDTAYTICDVPIFGLVTTMTDNQQERMKLNNTGRLFGTFAAIVVAIVIPLFRQPLGGWTTSVIILSIIGAIIMIPICLSAKERVVEKEKEEAKEENYSIKDMFNCLKNNKYLLIFFSAYMVSSFCNVGANWGLYLARYCYGGEKMASVLTAVAIVPIFIGAFSVPIVCKKVDKFKYYKFSIMFGLVANIIKFVVGYENLIPFLILSAVGSIPGGIAMMLLYQFTPDCYEYSRYKTGYNLRGIIFAAQTFFVKMATAIAGAVSSYALTFIGFIEGEGAVQAAGFSDKLWNYSCIGAMVGTIFTLIVLHFYKLNDHDVQLMAKYNSGEISKEEAAAQMKNTY